MAECKECGAKLGFLSRSGDLCLDCAAAAFKAGEGARREAARLDALEQTQEATQNREAAISAVLLTTETTPNLKITKRIEIVTAEVAYGMNIFKDLFVAVRDVVWRKGSLKSTLIVRQNWITASEKTAGRPGLPSGGASQVISLSSQISKDLRLFSEAV